MDKTPPTLTSFSLTPVVDVSSGKGILEISMTAFDTESEIDDAVIYFNRDLSYGNTNSTTPTSNYSFIGLYGYSDSWADGQVVEKKSLFEA